MQLDDILAEPMTPLEFHGAVKQHIHALRARRGFSAQDRAKYLKDKHHQVAQRMIDQAQLPLQGMLVLPGTAKPHFVGDPPDWHTLQFNDNEYVWGINRMVHWQKLLAAFTLTGDRKYAEKVVRELENWIDTCPRPELDKTPQKAHEHFGSAVTPWRSLEVGIRMFETWPWVLEHLIDTDILSPELLAKTAVSVYEHGEVLEEICPIFWPNADHNHYLMENLGLLSLACLFPQFRKAEQWRTFAMHELERCAAAQLMPSGGQIEGCPSYHNYCMYWFLLAPLIARENGLAFSPQYLDRMHRSLEYSVHAFRPSGTIVPWGDSDADLSVVHAAVYACLAMDDPRYLQAVAGILGLPSVLDRCLDFAWQIGDFDALADKLRQPSRPWPNIAWFTDLKQVAMRTGWDRHALSVFFACRTPVNNAHAHIDPMSFDFCGLGQTLIVDPGRFTYREDADRRKYKSPEWHSMLTIDRKSPFEYISTWAFGPQKEGKITNVYQGRGLLAADAVQLNYEPAVHRRLVAIVDGSFLLVLDRVTDLSPASSVQIYYHLNSTDAVWNGDARTAVARISEVGLLVAVTPNLQGELREGSISEAIDVARPSTRLCLEDSASGESDRGYAAVLVPYRATGRMPQVSDVQVQLTDNALVCSFMLNNQRHEFSWTQTGIERR